MPYKDPVKAQLQSQRWNEMHPEYKREYQKTKGRELDRKRRQDPKRIAWNREWREKNRERLNDLRKRWALWNSEKHKANKRRYYLKHVEQEKARAKAFYENNKKHCLDRQREYTKKNAVQVRGARQSWVERNRDKQRKYALDYYYRHHEKNRAKAANSHHKRRQQINTSAPFLREVSDHIFFLKHSASVICSYCSRPIQGSREVVIDHYYPLAKGGLHVIANIRPSCHDCNSRKSDMLPGEWEDFMRENPEMFLKGKQ